MQERDLWWKIVLVGVLVALGFASVWPIQEKIKYGIDLAGGYSLLYELDSTGMEGSDRTNLSQRVIEVLRRRVDPKGVFNLVWRPVGANRIEIQMPAAAASVKEARAAFESLQQELQDTIVRRSSIVSAVSRPEGRAAAFERLSNGVPARLPLLQAAAKAYDDLRAMDALKDVNATRSALLSALALPAEQRQAALDAMIAELPDRKAPIEVLVKAYDELKIAEAAPPPAEPAAVPATDDVTAKRVAYEAALQRVLNVVEDRIASLERDFDNAVGAVVATNVDINQLLSLLELKPRDPQRKAKLDELSNDFPGLASLIGRIVEQSDSLKETRRRGEGRLEDPADLQRLLKGAGVLEFRIIPTGASDPKFDEYRSAIKRRGPRPQPGESTYQWFQIEDPIEFLNLKKDQAKLLETQFEEMKKGFSVVVERYGDKYYVLSHIGEGYTMTHSARSGESDWSLVSAFSTRDQQGGPAIGFRLDTVGGTKFGPLTRTHRGSQLAIFIDDECISHATINSPIVTEGIIQGRFTPQEVHEMVKKLNAGSLPQKLKDPPISVRAIGPSLGKANQESGLRAGAIGAICVAIFMIFYYRYAGFVAVVAVAINILFTFSMMAILGATLTMPGIAGIVLAIGMAVDANVLINERIREELNRGTALRMAVKLGYERAFSAILDSNVTTILTCIILYLIGSEQIKGFGLTLGIGVFINVFTAYFVTRMFFDMMSMISIPREVLRRPFVIGVVVTALGAGLYALGYALNTAEGRTTSTSIAFGKSLIGVGPAVLILLFLMWLIRVIHANRKTLPMSAIIGIPNINWIAARKYFFAISTVVVAGSIALFIFLPAEKLYDIEFLGGVNAQIDLKADSPITKLPTLSDKQKAIEERLSRSAVSLKAAGEAMSKAQITGASGTYTVATPGVPASRLATVIRQLLKDNLSSTNGVSYSDPASEVVTVHTAEARELDQTKLKSQIAQAFNSAAEAIAGSQVQAIAGFESGGAEGRSFTVVTRETNKELVMDAIVENLEADLDIQQALEFKLATNTADGGVNYFPIRESNPKSLGINLTDSEAASLELEGWEGGVAIVLENVNPPQDIPTLQRRLKSMRLQPDFEKYGWRESKVLGVTLAPNSQNLYSRLIVLVTDENYPLLDDQGNLSGIWQSELAIPEVELLQSALQRQTSLASITQFDREVSDESKVQAYVALALSWIIIIAYLWFRFGSARWGTAAVIALVHDAIVAVGAVAFTSFLAGTALGSMLLINETIRIDLAVVAALLTIVGFSVNDTIVIFDRIRENRGRMKDISAEIINASVNQTMSRTILTTLTAIITVLIMYIWGGRGIHSINFTLLAGMVSGTYSTVGIATQFLLRREQVALAKA